MYAVGVQFNRSARRLDRKLEELGGKRFIDVGLCDDQAAELYRGELEKWMEKLQPQLFGKASVVLLGPT
jgi:sulfite reductase alpha subunit-like flavoprotein